mgnify:FL=1
MERKEKLRFIQISLTILGILIIFFTYFEKDKSAELSIIPAETKKKIKNQLANQSVEGDVFYNIEYSGLDISGNRYILKSLEAYNNKNKKEIINMKSVEAVFYFKDDTVLKVQSNNGTYNNKTLDMTFDGNVKGFYEGSDLFAEKAEYSNSKSYLKISENVKINDLRGAVVADKLLFDIKKQTLKIASFNDGKVNTKVNLK